MTIWRGGLLVLFILTSGCSGPMKRMNKGISSDAGAVLYQFPLRECPTPSAELPPERVTQKYVIKAGSFYDPNIFIKKMPYCHGFTKYSFEEIRDKDPFYVFSAYVRLDREGLSCSLQVATPAEVDRLKNPPSDSPIIQEQTEYIQSFLETIMPASVSSREPKLEFFRNSDEWQSWCHKRIRLKTFR